MSTVNLEDFKLKISACLHAVSRYRRREFQKVITSIIITSQHIASSPNEPIESTTPSAVGLPETCQEHRTVA